MVAISHRIAGRIEGRLEAAAWGYAARSERSFTALTIHRSEVIGRYIRWGAGKLRMEYKAYSAQHRYVTHFRLKV